MNIMEISLDRRIRNILLSKMHLITLSSLLLLSFGVNLHCAYSQTENIGKKILYYKYLPCDVRFWINIERQKGPSSSMEDVNVRELLAQKQEKQCEFNSMDNITCVRYDFSLSLCLKLFFENKRKHDTMSIRGYVSTEILKKTNDGFSIYYKDEVGYFDFPCEVPPKSVDSIGMFLKAEFSKNDTGIYMVYARYKQKCGNEITTKYSNRVYFRVIN